MWKFPYFARKRYRKLMRQFLRGLGWPQDDVWIYFLLNPQTSKSSRQQHQQASTSQQGTAQSSPIAQVQQNQATAPGLAREHVAKEYSKMAAPTQVRNSAVTLHHAVTQALRNAGSQVNPLDYGCRAQAPGGALGCPLGWASTVILGRLASRLTNRNRSVMFSLNRGRTKPKSSPQS